MSHTDFLRSAFPALADRLPRTDLAILPTPLDERPVDFAGSHRTLYVKRDDLTSGLYGGNKVRKLEYLFARARQRDATRIATFGAAGSNHALATAIFAKAAGFECTAFLSHQAKTPQVAATLNRHIEIGTELVSYGGTYARRIGTLRRHLQGRRAWVIPMGGSSWLGTVGFVAAGLELAADFDGRTTLMPKRLYVATGTMGTAVGIALGLALARVDVEVQAVRVSDVSIMNQAAMERLLGNTVLMMRRLDPTLPADLAQRASIRVRDDFFGPGYAKGTEATDEAIAFGHDELGLDLEVTYTGKAMAALLADWRDRGNRNALYWHTYNSAPLGVPADRPLDANALPPEFLRYFGD